MTMALRGYAKLVEEFGELLTVVGKGQGCPTDEHFDGKGSIHARTQDEIADCLAALQFIVAVNGFDSAAVSARARQKVAQFLEWNKS